MTLRVCAGALHGETPEGTNREGHGGPRREAYCRRVAKQCARVVGRWSRRHERAEWSSFIPPRQALRDSSVAGFGALWEWG
jgi:hypothetical protein